MVASRRDSFGCYEKAGGRAAGFRGSALRAAQLAASVAIEEIDDEAGDDPAAHPQPVVLERDREEREAAERAEHTDDRRGRHAEPAYQVGARAAQHEHADADR